MAVTQRELKEIIRAIARSNGLEVSNKDFKDISEIVPTVYSFIDIIEPLEKKYNVSLRDKDDMMKYSNVSQLVKFINS